MFRRNGKGPFDATQILYQEEGTPDMYTSYSSRSETSINLFDAPKPAEARPLNPMPEPISLPSESITFTEEPETTLGEGVSFKGELSFERLLRIDGHFEGVLISKGKVIVGPKGIVKADISMEEAIIEGSVEGDIHVSKRVELRGGAVVKGNVEAGILCIDEGVRLFGHVAVAGVTQSEETGL